MADSLHGALLVEGLALVKFVARVVNLVGRGVGVLLAVVVVALDRPGRPVGVVSGRVLDRFVLLFDLIA